MTAAKLKAPISSLLPDLPKAQPKARHLKTVFHYTVGRIYSLSDLGEIAPRLKTISSRKTKQGLFHLYREMGTHKMWMQGPFKGEGSSGFMYLGERETKSQLQKFLVSEFKALLQDFVTKSAEAVMSGGRRNIGVVLETDRLCFFDLDDF